MRPVEMIEPGIVIAPLLQAERDGRAQRGRNRSAFFVDVIKSAGYSRKFRSSSNSLVISDTYLMSGGLVFPEPLEKPCGC
jgi:hypothetical protein